MKRMITEKLAAWKDSRRRKPLLLTGVRQCGKTWSLKAFGHDFFEKTVYVNFEESGKLSSILIMITTLIVSFVSFAWN